ncbi:hypothetical protein [Prevotella pallens]|uniref:hypothetical protein n=1 Tax=Prevotella pallens TaxID=60133 RepID=UPI001CB4E8E4|nr:hypothetical protein [Prevotella pallens]MBF1469069.1 hypothetical protein [Prevotella pallens]
MLGYGYDESAPTPCGMFVENFVVECEYLTEYSPYYSNPLVALWQGTSSCRGRFIVPAYMYAPT